VLATASSGAHCAAFTRAHAANAASRSAIVSSRSSSSSATTYDYTNSRDDGRAVTGASIRPCRDDDRDAMFAIVNAAAEAYRGVIPPDRWHEPYMPRDELYAELDAGVVFWGYESDGELLGIMGIQPVRDVELIRHAYVKPGNQGSGIGSALLEHIAQRSTRRMLVGTWAAAEWAIRFYRAHRFEPVGPAATAALLKAYWTIPERQIASSVVLARPPLSDEELRQLANG
jgi:GNAT superfamily N-acetyltransferase